MDLRNNCGYIITDSIHIGDTEFVLGINNNAPSAFVTWACRNGTDYYWGHYFTDLLSAQKDLCSRAVQKIECLESARAEQEILPSVEPSVLLPDTCHSVLPSSGELIVIKRGEKGYFRSEFSIGDEQKNREFADDRNSKQGVSKAQEAAMLAGSMFGWHTPAADPKNYNDKGEAIRHPKKRERGEAR